MKKKHKLRYEPNNFQLSWPHRPLRKLWIGACPQVQWAHLPLHHLTGASPFARQAWTASSPASQPPEQLKSSPSLPPQKEVVGRGIDELFWWYKGLSLVLSIDTVLFVVVVVVVFFATEIKRGQGTWREQPSKLRAAWFCLSISGTRKKWSYSFASLPTPPCSFLPVTFSFNTSSKGMRTPPCPSFSLYPRFPYKESFP